MMQNYKVTLAKKPTNQPAAAGSEQKFRRKKITKQTKIGAPLRRVNVVRVMLSCALYFRASSNN